MNLYIFYKNGTHNVFEEKQLNCTKLTIRGHTSALIEAWQKGEKGISKIDSYNAVLLNEVICIRVV